MVDVVGDHPTDAELVARTLADERWAAEALARRHVKPVAAMVTRMIGDRDAADEIVQESFTIAFERLAQLRDPSAVRSWLLTIAARGVRRRFRRNHLLNKIGLSPTAQEPDFSRVVTAAATPEQRAELVLLAKILGRQPAAHRLAWMLRHVEGHSLEESARLCECSLATVKRWIRRVDGRVRAHVRMEEPRHD